MWVLRPFPANFTFTDRNCFVKINIGFYLFTAAVLSDPLLWESALTCMLISAMRPFMRDMRNKKGSCHYDQVYIYIYKKHILCSIAIHMSSLLLPMDPTASCTYGHHESIIKKRESPNTCPAETHNIAYYSEKAKEGSYSVTLGNVRYLKNNRIIFKAR